MRFSTITAVPVLAGLATAVPFSFPLKNGFPNLNATELAKVEKLAGGTLPNTPLPTSLKPNGVAALQLIVTNEIFEVAYFTELVYNITHKVKGYEASPQLLDSLIAVVNQEQLHALGANAILSSAKQPTIAPCKYEFPVTNLEAALALAETFTEVVLGILPGAQSLFAADGGDEAALLPLIGSIIAQEGEQNGYYRALQEKVASAAPFLTGGAPQFAATVISQFIVPGSCPSTNVMPFKTFPGLTVERPAKAKDSTLLYSVDGEISASNSSIAYISGQNFPVTTPIVDVVYDKGKGKSFFFADFPYSSGGFARGLTIAAVVSGVCPKLNSSAAVASMTMYGPGLIVVD